MTRGGGGGWRWKGGHKVRVWLEPQWPRPRGRSWAPGRQASGVLGRDAEAGDQHHGQRGSCRCLSPSPVPEPGSLSPLWP